MPSRFLMMAMLLVSAAAACASPPLTDADIRNQIIAESIRSYPGNCPCPWNADRAGRMCGRRSAYTKPGGFSPKCYEHDVSDDEVKAYRARRLFAEPVAGPAIQVDMPSTVIRTFSYDPARRQLAITFQSGKRYVYDSVPPQIYEAMKKSFSKGEFFNEHIRDRFTFERES